jgi:hypothetical protein
MDHDDLAGPILKEAAYMIVFGVLIYIFSI